MESKQPRRFKTITEFHNFRGLSKPDHPLLSVIDLDTIKHMPANDPALVFDFYSISLKKNFNAEVKYGQQQYDFDAGIMFFMSPGQVIKISVDKDTVLQQSGWTLLVHPDFLWNTALSKAIKQYEYFDYAVHEALFVSDKEEIIIAGIMKIIQQEYHSNIDKFSQGIIIAQLEVLLNYADRFYNRQFITRKIINHSILARFEEKLSEYFSGDMLLQKGIPQVSSIANDLNVSPNYLGGLLKVLTGKSTQQHVQDKLIEKAKEQLSTTNLTVSEIAYALGFEHPQSFSKLFKTKTSFSPLQFRQSFN